MEPDDRVLVKKLERTRRAKVEGSAEMECYRVARLIPDLPIYKVQSETNGKYRIFHRNLMLPFTSILPVAATEPTISEGHLSKNSMTMKITPTS